MQYNTAHYSTVQYSAVQHNCIHYNTTQTSATKQNGKRKLKSTAKLVNKQTVNKRFEKVNIRKKLHNGNSPVCNASSFLFCHSHILHTSQNKSPNHKRTAQLHRNKSSTTPTPTCTTTPTLARASPLYIQETLNTEIYCSETQSFNPFTAVSPSN